MAKATQTLEKDLNKFDREYKRAKKDQAKVKKVLRDLERVLKVHERQTIASKNELAKHRKAVRAAGSSAKPASIRKTKSAHKKVKTNASKQLKQHSGVTRLFDRLKKDIRKLGIR